MQEKLARRANLTSTGKGVILNFRNTQMVFPIAFPHHTNSAAIIPPYKVVREEYIRVRRVNYTKSVIQGGIGLHAMFH